MDLRISRRAFLAFAGSALAVSSALSASEETLPTSLDHIILGINDLDRGIAFMREHTGVQAAFGGVHPGRGTRNALLSLGPQRYLEIMAPDPEQKGQPSLPLREFLEPRLAGWAVHTNDINALAERIHGAGFVIDGPNAGSRVRPDGKILEWKLLRLKEDRGGLLPFFIEWGRQTTHPSADAPTGCELVKFFVLTPDPKKLYETLGQLDVRAMVADSKKPRLSALIAGPKGEVELTS